MRQRLKCGLQTGGLFFKTSNQAAHFFTSGELWSALREHIVEWSSGDTSCWHHANEKIPVLLALYKRNPLVAPFTNMV